MKKILVIDDDQPFRMAVMATLRRQGYEVLGAENGMEGLTLSIAYAPGLILSDVNMAGRNGFELLRELRAHPATTAIPVIIMTGEPQKADARFSMERGADDYLAKPFAMENMLAAVAARLLRQTEITGAADAQIEEERMGTAEQLRLQTSALEAAANGIAITQLNGKILWVNQAFAKLTGYDAKEVVGRTPAVLKSGRHSKEFYADMWQTILAGNVWHGELVNKRKDGRCYHEEMTITPLRGTDGKIQYFIAIKQDVSARKETELRLAQERDLLQALMDNQPDHIYFKDANSKFTRINRALARFLGLPGPEAAIGKSDANFFSMQEARQKLVDERRMLATGEPILGLVERSVSAQESIWVSSTKVPIYGADKVIIGLVGISHDITKRKQAEEALLESKRFLQSTLDALSSHIAILDEHGTIIEVNAAWTRFARENGLAGNFGVGDNYLEICRSATGNFASEGLSVAHGICAVMAGKRDEFHQEYPCHSPHEQRWFVVRATRFGGASPVRVVVAHENITERKRAEQELQWKTAFLEAQVNSSIDGILVVDEQGKKILQNQRLAGLLKIPPHIVADENDEQQLRWVVNTTRDPEQFMAKVTYLNSHPDEISRDEIVLKDGTILDRYSSPLLGHDGKYYGRIWTFRDITESKRREVQLVQSQKLETVGQLAAGIAHEINTPMQFVGDNTRFLKDGFESIVRVLRNHTDLLGLARQNALTPEVIAQAETILAASDHNYFCEQIPLSIKETLEGVERVTKIVRAMKDFSHPGGREKTASDLNRGIESTVTVTRNEWKYVADLKLELEPELPLVPCFVGEFNQCILNLIVNSAHAIGEVVAKNPETKGLITVQTRRAGAEVEVRVTDTGGGIPEAARAKIFEPFFTTKEVGKGTGQGLSMVYGSIVKRHGGTVEFETEVGRGTTFIIRLPLKSPVAPVGNPSSVSSPTVA